MNSICIVEITPESLEEMAQGCVPIQERILPLLDNLKRLVAKGPEKTAEDRAEIQKLQGDINREFAEIIGGRQIIGGQCVTNSTVDTPVSHEGSRNVICLNNLNTDGGTFATADAEMFFTEWSHNFVHGSDSMLPITALAEKILREGERLSSLTGITWRRPMRHNLKLAVYGQEFPELTDKDQYILEGGFETSDGRKLTVLGIDNPDSEINHRATNNPYANDTLCPCDNCCSVKNGTYSFRIHRPDIDSCFRDLAASQPLSVATMIEMLTLALSFAGNNGHQSKQQVLKVLGGLRDLPIPQDMESIFGDEARLQVKFLEEQKKNGRSGMTLIPFKYKFPHQKDFSDGMAASTTSADLARCL